MINDTNYDGYNEDLANEIYNLQNEILANDTRTDDIISALSLLHDSLNYLLFGLVFLIGIVIVAVFFIGKGAVSK